MLAQGAQDLSGCATGSVAEHYPLCRGPPIVKILVGAAVLAGAAFGALKVAESKGVKLELKRQPGVDTVQERKKNTKFPF